MAAQPDLRTEARIPLSRERVLRAAVDLADTRGIESLTMRNLAHELGVEAMSLYYHVANKEEVLDGVVDLIAGEINDVVGRIDMPSNGPGWKQAVRQRILSARDVLLHHSWAPGVLETRTNLSPSVLIYFDGLLGLLRGGGFSNDQSHHALHALGSRALGFTQELFNPSEPGEDDSNTVLESLADQLPYLVSMMMEVAHDDPDSTLGWCDDQFEFEFGLDLILDGLDGLIETV